MARRRRRRRNPDGLVNFGLAASVVVILLYAAKKLDAK